MTTETYFLTATHPKWGLCNICADTVPTSFDAAKAALLEADFWGVCSNVRIMRFFCENGVAQECEDVTADMREALLASAIAAHEVGGDAPFWLGMFGAESLWKGLVADRAADIRLNAQHVSAERANLRHSF